jgi:hypothetical protein
MSGSTGHIILLDSLRCEVIMSVNNDPIDLFEDHKSQPPELSEMTTSMMHQLEKGNYNRHEVCANFRKAMRKIGYTFDFGLDCEPYDLRPLDIPAAA